MDYNTTTDVFPAISFYGSKNKRKLACVEKNVEDTIRKNTAQKIPKSFKARLTGPSVHWKTFYKQNEAFRYSRSKAADLHVFAYESKMLGDGKRQRMYLVTSHPVFWHYYNQLDQCQLHHYEVIPGGAVCKLYFDLEFMKHVNTGKDGARMVEFFVKYVCLWLKHRYDVQCSIQDILNLDSSTESKFSRHLVFILKNVAFCDNIHAGSFVHYILEQLLTRLKPCPDQKVEGIIENDNLRNDTESVSAIGHCSESTFNERADSDSNNTYGSHCESEESGTSTQEKELPKTKTDSKNSEHDAELGISQNVFNHFSAEQLQSFLVYDKNGDKCLFCDSGVYTKNRNFRLYLSSKLGKDNPLLISTDSGFFGGSDDEESKKQVFMASLITNVKYTDKMRVLTFETTDKQIRKLHADNSEDDVQEANDGNVVHGNSKSPYPEVDNFIANLVRSAGNTGSIRHWTYFSQGEILVYDISHYRFCHNIGRHHKSNNIMLIVDLRRGVYYQKCHDYDCKRQNFKSADFPVAKEVLPAHFFEDGESFDEDDDDIVDAANEVENEYQSSSNVFHSAGGANTELDDVEEDLLISAADEMERSLHE